jgi:hypothetical protein
MQNVPFTEKNPLPKDFVNITSQLEDLFVHPWALNVPLNEHSYLQEDPQVKRRHRDYLEQPSTLQFMESITKGPLNNLGFV